MWGTLSGLPVEPGLGGSSARPVRTRTHANSPATEGGRKDRPMIHLGWNAGPRTADILLAIRGPGEIGLRNGFLPTGRGSARIALCGQRVLGRPVEAPPGLSDRSGGVDLGFPGEDR